MTEYECLQKGYCERENSAFCKYYKKYYCDDLTFFEFIMFLLYMSFFFNIIMLSYVYYYKTMPEAIASTEVSVEIVSDNQLS